MRNGPRPPRSWLSALLPFVVTAQACTPLAPQLTSRANGAPPAPAPASAARFPNPPSWTGHNVSMARYHVAPGYPVYQDHARYLGELSGSWRQIGVQYGERAGDWIRLTYEGWYREIIKRQGSDEAIRQYLNEQRAYYAALVPEVLDVLRGIADGAAEQLDHSELAGRMSNEEKILLINSYYGLLAPSPDVLARTAARAAADESAPACSGAVMLGHATAGGHTIHVSSEDQHFFPQEYLVTFIVNPSAPGAHRFTVTDTAGEIGSEHALNDAGVAVSAYAGGSIGVAAPTRESPFSGYRRAGLDWQVGDFYVAAFADSAAEAVQLLTVGRAAYRNRSGKKIVIGKCARGANWLVSDDKQAFVVESIPADENGVARYAVRRPGDLGETGASYIVTTNNVEAGYSCDENNVCDRSHPMSRHGHYSQQPSPFFGLSNPGMRFWTLTWLIKNAYGQITPELVKKWRTSHFVYDEAGTRHATVNVNGKEVPAHLAPGVATLCWHTSGPAGVDTFQGVNTYVSLSVADERTVWRTKGRPCEWVGPWDAVTVGPSR